MITFFDAFAGIGGFRIALERLGWKCVGWCEIDKQAQKTYKTNFNTDGEYFCDDIYKVKAEELPKFDVLTAGFPCQPFSLNGKRKGFEDHRGKLIFEVMRILKVAQPKVVFLENVKGILMGRMRHYFEEILEQLHQLGYYTYHTILDAQNFRVPQHRERVLVVAFKPKQEFLFPFGEQTHLRLRDILEVPKEVTIALDSQVKWNTVWGNQILDKDKVCKTLLSGEGQGDILVDNGVYRLLTVLERLRLQGFPESFKIPVSRSRWTIQIGNSVCVPMIQEVGERISIALTRQPIGIGVRVETGE